MMVVVEWGSSGPEIGLAGGNSVGLVRGWKQDDLGPFRLRKPLELSSGGGEDVVAVERTRSGWTA